MFISLILLAGVPLIYSQVGINTETPSTTLEIKEKSAATKVEGIIIPRLTGDEIYNMPIAGTTTNEANMVYATDAASSANQTGRGINLVGKGFYYWDGSKWVTFVNNVVNNIWAQVKPMNFLINDGDTYTSSPNNPFLAPEGPAIKLFDADYDGAGDFKILNNPLNVVMWDNTNKLIRVPQQLLGYTLTINLSLKFQKLSSNAEASRLVAYTGNTVVNTTNGTHSGGVKIKDLMFTGTKTAVGTVEPNYVRDELVLSPIIVTQQIINEGIKLYVGSAMNGTISFYEPVFSVDYGVVNTAQ